MSSKTALGDTYTLPSQIFRYRQQDALKMATQKALWLPEVGAEFRLGKTDIPEPGPGEVLIKLEATALNPLEWKTQQSGFFMVKEYPAIVGEDGAGVVQKVGDGVTCLSQGDKVSVLSFKGACRRAGTHHSHTVRFFQTSFGNKYTTYQEFCLTSAALAIKVSCCQICV